MKGKVSLFWTIVALLFFVVAVLEYLVFENMVAGTAAIVGSLVSSGFVFVLVKLDEIVNIRVIERRLIRRLFVVEPVKKVKRSRK